MVNSLFQRYFIYLVASIGALGGLLFGFDTGVISGALTFINQTYSPSTLTQEMIVSSVVLGALVGACCSGRLADRLGRRKMLLIVSLEFIVGTLWTVFAYHVQELILGRFIVGMAIGVCSYTAPLFISEMAPAKLRGSLVLINAITITGGEALAFLSDYLLTPLGSWRLMFAVGIIPAILLLIGMWFLPETPRWLVSKGLMHKAKRILERIRNHQNVDVEIHAIQQSFFLRPGGWRELFSKKIRPVLIIGIGLGILQQVFGINTVMYYGPTIFNAAGFHSISSQIITTFGMGLVNTVMSVVALFLVDHLGRRKLLIGGSFVAAISLGLLGLTFSHISFVSQCLSIICLIFYISGYCISVGSLFWLIIAEIFPLSIRGLGMSLATAIQWGANVLVSMTFLTIINTIGPRDTFWLYGSMCLISVVFCYSFVPETKGVSLEKIECNLQADKPLREIGLPLRSDYVVVAKAD